MLKIAKNITIEKDGQRITLSDEELKQIVRQAMGQELEIPQTIPVNPQTSAYEQPTITEQKISSPKQKPTTSTKKQKAHKSQPNSEPQVHISEEKKNQIMSHVHSRMNEIPQTLSFLLEGISYVPNYLPFIRKMIENEPGVSKVMNGKRVLYFKKRAIIQTIPQPPEQMAPAAPSTNQEPMTTLIEGEPQIQQQQQQSPPASPAIDNPVTNHSNNNVEIA